MFRFFFQIVLLFIFVSCSVKSRKEQNELKLLVNQKQFDEALTYLDKSVLKQDKKNRLLFLMERGRILYLQQKFKEASAVFVEANELVDKLYTKSIRETIAAGILSDNSKSYYGSIFERSMLYYYQAMSYLALSRQSELSQDQRKYLFKARASLLAWDSFFKEINRKSGLKTLYRGSLVGKVLAASIHEEIGTKSEKNIALQLFKDAHKILETQGVTYSNFNSKNTTYIEKIKTKSKGYKKEIKKTSHYNQLDDFIDYKILRLTKELKSYQMKRMIKRYKPSAKVLKKIKTKKENIVIVLEQGSIKPMQAKMYSYTLKSAVNSIENPTTRALVNGIGVPIITYFALGPLGLGVPARSGNAIFYTRHNAGEALAKEAGIEFEMPSVEKSKYDRDQVLEVYDSKGQKLIKTEDLTLFGALDDIAFLQANERAENSYKKVGTKVAIKHIVAIIAAYKTYETVKKSSGEFFAKPAAFTQYVLSAKAIAETEKADVRHWTTLPSRLKTVELSLPVGEYTLKVKRVKDSVSRAVGTLKVDSKKRQVFTYSVL